VKSSYQRRQCAVDAFLRESALKVLQNGLKSSLLIHFKKSRWLGNGELPVDVPRWRVYALTVGVSN
jgi:hypothetical protein